MTTLRLVVLLIVASLKFSASEDTNDLEFPNRNNNCTTTDHRVENGRDNATYEKIEIVDPIIDAMLANPVDENLNTSRLQTFANLPTNFAESPILKFPKTPPGDRYKISSLDLDAGFFVFDFLRRFLALVQPNDVPIDLLKEIFDGRISVSSRLVSQSISVEAGFLTLVGICFLLACVTPAIEIWMTFRPNHADREPPRHPGFLAFLLGIFLLILGCGILTMTACNEAVGTAIEKIPIVLRTAIDDLGNYHSGTTTQLRLTLTRSLDVASEALLADLDDVEELLGKPVQEELSAETGLDVALDALLDVANATMELSTRTEALLLFAEKARSAGEELGRDANELRRQMETAVRGCSQQDRPLCATLDPSGLHLAHRLDRLLRDDRLGRLRATSRENLTESGRQARGEYLYVPHHVARVTLDVRNEIRREMGNARTRIFEEARGLETSTTELSQHLETARRMTSNMLPHLESVEETRWLIGTDVSRGRIRGEPTARIVHDRDSIRLLFYVSQGAVLAVLLVWILLFAALCCRCGSAENKIRPILLSAVVLSCLVSVSLWFVIVADLTVTTHTEMVLCRPLHDPEYRTVEALLERPGFLEKPLGVPLKELLRKCEENQPAYPVFHLGGSATLEHLTAHWTWPGLSRALPRLKVDLKGLRILTPNLQQRLQNLLYASGANLTEHRMRIQGAVLNKDLAALSDQLDNVARQLLDRKTARDLDAIASTTRNLLTRGVQPLAKMHDDLVYQLTMLDVQLQPLQRQVNQSISHLKTIQYYIDNRGEKIAQLKTKAYVDRLGGYLDQWRAHVLTEMGNGVAKCRPLWDVVNGVRLLLCQHLLGPLNGFWFATILCVLVLMASTPTAHVLAAFYKKEDSKKETVLLTPRMESPDTITMDRETWRSPETPPSDGW